MNNLPTSQIKLRFSVLAIIFGPALFIMVISILASVYADVPFYFFSRDPTATLSAHPLTGMQSNFGVLVWCAAAVICFFSCAILQRTQSNKTILLFLLWSGLITSVLTLDDLFLFHDDLAHRYFRLNEIAVYLSYVLVMLWYVTRFQRIILGSEYSLLLLAVVFFGLSITIDLFLANSASPWRIFFEDGFKLLGIVSWSSYLIRTCFQVILSPRFDRP